MSSEDTGEVFYVVVNHEEQYSIWPSPEPPAGWSVVGAPGSRDACLERIETLWTDMRPRSLRELMAAAPEPEPEPSAEPEPGPDLVTRLCRDQEVELELFGPASNELLRERLEQGVIHLRFPATRGETLLAIELDPATRELAAKLDELDELELCGSLQLDFVDLECRARVEPSSGRGRAALSRR
jgi:MbtH protein